MAFTGKRPVATKSCFYRCEILSEMFIGSALVLSGTNIAWLSKPLDAASRTLLIVTQYLSRNIIMQHLSLFPKKEALVTDFNKWRLLWSPLHPFMALPWPERYIWEVWGSVSICCRFFLPCSVKRCASCFQASCFILQFLSCSICKMRIIRISSHKEANCYSWKFLLCLRSLVCAC